MLSTLLNMLLILKHYSTFTLRRILCSFCQFRNKKVQHSSQNSWTRLYNFTGFRVEFFLSFPSLTMGWLGKWNVAVTMSMSFRDFNLHSGIVNARTCKQDVSKRRGKCLNNCNSNTVSVCVRVCVCMRVCARVLVLFNARSFGTED